MECMQLLMWVQKKFECGRCARDELTYTFVMGSLPVIACTTAAEVGALVNALLAAFVFVSLLMWKTTFREFLLIGKSRELHHFFVNIGGSLLMAFRATLGAMIGFVLVWYCRDLDGMSTGGVFEVLAMLCLHS